MNIKKVYKVKGMHCNSCAHLIEETLKGKVNSVSVDYARGEAEIDFSPEKISEKKIIEEVGKEGYKLEEKGKEERGNSTNLGWLVLIVGVLVFMFLIYKLSGFQLPAVQIPQLGDKTSLLLLFAAGLLTGFHCIAMCGGFVVSYTAKNAVKGNKGFGQHLIYGGSKVISYTIIGGIFGMIGGLVAFSVGLRGWVAIIAGIFMIFYALSIFGFKFFRRFQFNPKFLTRFASKESGKFSGVYSRPMITGLLNGLFIACGPLQAMYLYAAGTGSILGGASSLFAFGLGTLPVMLGFGSLATVIGRETTGKILKVSAILVLILGLIMLNRGLTLTGSPWTYDGIKTKLVGTSIPATSNSGNTNSVSAASGVQEVNMQVSGTGYSPNSFVIKKGVPVKWNVQVSELTECDSELVFNQFGIDAKLKQGMNTFEFTPDKAGTFSFSCGMGMLHGSFIVTDDGTATQQQVAASTPASGMQCGMSAGCGCGK